MTVSTIQWDETVSSASHSTTKTPPRIFETVMSAKPVIATQMAPWMEDSVTLRMTQLWGSLPDSAAVKTMLKVPDVIDANQDFMGSVQTSSRDVNGASVTPGALSLMVPIVTPLVETASASAL